MQSLAEPVSSSVVDGSGRLWTLGQETGDLVWFDGTERHVRRAVVHDPGDTELVVIDGQPALVDRATCLVRTVGDDGGFRARSCLDIDPADRSVRVAGSEGARRLLVVSGDDGVLRVSDLGSGECGEVVVDVADPDSDLGAPEESQGKVFIPNYTTGTVVIVDLETRERARPPASWWSRAPSSSCSNGTASCSTTTRAASGPVWCGWTAPSPKWRSTTPTARARAWCPRAGGTRPRSRTWPPPAAARGPTRAPWAAPTRAGAPTRSRTGPTPRRATVLRSPRPASSAGTGRRSPSPTPVPRASCRTRPPDP